MSRSLPSLLLLAACSGAMPGPAGDDADADADGWTPANGDCNDNDPAVNPLAIDEPLDGTDQDCDGADAEALAARALVPGDLRITELMPDPLGVDPAYGEWVEVYNTLDLPVELEGVLLRDDVRDDAFIGVSTVVEPGSYTVLGGTTDPALNGGVPVSVVWEADMGLSNAADAFVIEVDGVVIDRVAWTPSWPGGDGQSIALDLDAPDPTLPTSWCPGTEAYGVGGYGSPGQANPACPAPFTGRTAAELQAGDLVITEVLQSPAAVDDELGEWIEVHNPGPTDIDLQGLTLVSDDGDAVDIDEQAIVPAGAYVVLSGFADPAANGGVVPVWTWGWDYGLRGSGMQIALMVGTRLVDEIRYDNGISFPDPAGATMSLDPAWLDAEGNDDGTHWCEATTPFGAGDLGTPGAANDPC